MEGDEEEVFKNIYNIYNIIIQTPGLSQDNLDEIQQCVDEFLTGKIFNENEADQLINDILEKVMEI